VIACHRTPDNGSPTRSCGPWPNCTPTAGRTASGVWRRDTLVGGAIGIGIGGVISGDSLFGRHQGAVRVAVADMAAWLEEAGGLLIDAQWDSLFLRSLGAEPVPREDYLPLLGHPAERIALPSRPRPARRLRGPG
jgi:leucyl/phenylalanyl-tRNA---protein transferase